MVTDFLLALLEEGSSVNLRRAGLPDALDEIDVGIFFREEVLHIVCGWRHPLFWVCDPGLCLVTTVELRAERRREDRSSSLLGVKACSGLESHAIREGRLQLFNERGVGIAEEIGCTAMDREDQRLLVDSHTVCVDEEDEDKTTTLVWAGLTGVDRLPVIVQIGIPGIKTFDAALIGVLNKGYIFTETTVEDNHARRLKEDAFVFVAVVVGVDVLFRLGELLDVTGPADTSKCSVLKEEATLCFVIENLGINQIPHFTLILFCVQVPREYRHLFREWSVVLGTGVEPEQRLV